MWLSVELPCSNKKDVLFKTSEIRRNILIINNTKFAIIADPVRIIRFFGAADFTEHVWSYFSSPNYRILLSQYGQTFTSKVTARPQRGQFL
jgi:hypothetical protein